jgi:hypothetical protein
MLVLLVTGFLQWVRKHVDKLSRVEVRKTAVGLKTVEKLSVLVCLQFATRDHVPRIRCDDLQCVLMGDDVGDESSRSRFEVQGSACPEATANGRLSEYALNPAVCDMALFDTKN